MSELRALRLLSRAPLVWRSGYDDLLTAVRLLQDAGVDVRLTVEATGPERPRVLFHIEDLGLRDQVTLAAVDGEDTATFDAVVLAALDDSAEPRTTAAAQRASALVVTSVAAKDVRGAPFAHVIEVPPLSPGALCSALLRLAGQTSP